MLHVWSFTNFPSVSFQPVSIERQWSSVLLYSMFQIQCSQDGLHRDPNQDETVTETCMALLASETCNIALRGKMKPKVDIGSNLVADGRK